MKRAAINIMTGSEHNGEHNGEHSSNMPSRSEVHCGLPGLCAAVSAPCLW
jgi:hypothetical protein